MRAVARDSAPRTHLKAVRRLADLQERVARDLHGACSDALAAGESWSAIGRAVGINRETVFRQFYGADVIVATRPHQATQKPREST